MKKVLLLALPLIALTFGVACKNQEATQPAATDQVEGAAPESTPATAQPAEKKGN